MFSNLDVNKTLQTLMALYALNIGNQFYQGYKMSHIEDRIKDQLNGRFDQQAEELRKMKKEIGTATSNIASASELQSKASRELEQYSEETRTKVEQYMKETNAQITSLSSRVRRVGVSISGLKSTRPTTPVEPPKSDWKGVSKKDADTCRAYPDKCESYPFEIKSPLRNGNGNSIITLTSPNLWEGIFDTKLDLSFKITTIGFREKTGVAQNQSVIFQVGYQEGGKFTALEEFKVNKGDSDETDVFFHEPVMPVSFRDDLKWYEVSFLAGAVFSPISVSGSSLDFRTGLSLNVGMLNFRGGEIRLGANAVLSPDVLGGGVFSSYHPKLFGRRLNIAPKVGVLYDSQFRSALQIGIISEVW
jgi:hypothetical protein